MVLEIASKLAQRPNLVPSSSRSPSRSYGRCAVKMISSVDEKKKTFSLQKSEEAFNAAKIRKAAVARPRFGANGDEEVSGKIGIFPFTYKDSTKRSSKNRAASTLETKAIVPVTKEVIRSYMIEKVLPAIRSKWPRCSAIETIYIQQDNARPHISPSDTEFLAAACKDEFDICLSFQPPNSPDMNVLDLGYFRAIQSLQYQEAPRNIDELVCAVAKSFKELLSESLNNVFLSLQACMIEVLKACGGNNYKLPHMSKHQLMRDGKLPSQLHCEQDVVENLVAYLQQ